MRIDRAITPPGLVKGAMCYSLFSTDKGLYIIKTGRGWRLNFNPKGGANQYAVNKVITNLQGKVTATEKQLKESDLDDEVSTRKDSIFVSKQELSDMEVKSRYDGLPELKFKISNKKFRVQFDKSQDDEVTAFAESL